MTAQVQQEGTVNEPEPKQFKPSGYQLEIFEWIAIGSGSAIIEAVAGSGKTTTIVIALELIPKAEKTIFMAFNVKIVKELKLRVPTHARVATFHSAGLGALKKRYPSAKLDDDKVRKIIKADYENLPTEVAGSVCQLVSLAKRRGLGCLHPDTNEAWQQLIDHYDVQVDDWDDETLDVPVEQIINLARVALAKSIEEAKITIDFDDMIYMPVLLKLATHEYDWVFIDEAQDTNEVRRELAAMLLKRNGRLVAVGDSHQAIYGFTGADSDAMNLIGSRFGCKTMPLSICYRSDRRIVQVAQRIVPEIEARENAHEGLVKETDFDATPPCSSDAILCRNTAPLISLAYELIAQGRGCKILGRDIGRGLISLVKKMKALSIDDLCSKLVAYRDSEIRKHLRQGNEGKAQTVEDKVNSILAAIDHLPRESFTTEDLNSSLDSMFQENADRELLMLSTIHKAKGLEWDRVFFYFPSLIPSKWARQSWQQQQEENLRYVAVTRAKHELYLIGGDEREGAYE